jgi:serine protease Do
MKKNILITFGGLAALGLVLAALPSHSSPAPQVPAPQEQTDDRPQLPQLQQRLQSLRAPEAGEFEFSFGEGSWLGVETNEVTGEKAKELKLPAEHGVVLGKVMDDSPASKAGLKENDVVTEINGQRVEGASQFHRMIREIPAGRTTQLTVWRDGRSQSVSVTLGKADGSRRNWSYAAPGAFAFHMPEIPELQQLPELDFDGGMLGMTPRPRLGIDAEDLNGQLGTFFGAPEGEGILVREVTSGSVAEKAGLKAGDVIISLNGERIRSLGDLRVKLASRDSDKPASVKLGVLRNKSEVSVTVDLPAAAPHAKRIKLHETNI